MGMARAIFGPNSQTSNTNPAGGTGGTLGGRKIASGASPGMRLAIGDEGYLWLLTIIEALTLAFLRKKFKRFHGG
jgi:hypothetical protein